MKNLIPADILFQAHSFKTRNQAIIERHVRNRMSTCSLIDMIGIDLLQQFAFKLVVFKYTAVTSVDVSNPNEASC